MIEANYSPLNSSISRLIMKTRMRTPTECWRYKKHEIKTQHQLLKFLHHVLLSEMQRSFWNILAFIFLKHSS
jgi:hypothetical protein